MKVPVLLAAALLAGAAAPVAAQTAPARPTLVVAISVDQFSADLFAQYRTTFTGGLRRLQSGAVFPSGFQAHAATETCPGHSTILTGASPARNGIIANNWIDLAATREDKTIYCAEDERVPGSSSEAYTVSNVHLKVPTLGDRLKARNPASRTVAVAGKDRATVMMAGAAQDAIWWWSKDRFVSHPGRASTTVDRINAGIARSIAQPRPALTLPAHCLPLARPVAIEGGSVGDGRFARTAGDAARFRASPEMDGATLALAAELARDLGLGRRGAVDVLAVGLSATDYVGHGYGTEGSEMCLQLGELDRSLDGFFAALDATGVDYVVVLTADHGGLDLPERAREQAAPEAARATRDLAPQAVAERVARQLGLAGPPVIHGDGLFGDMWLRRDLSPADRDRVIAAARRDLLARPGVAAVYTRAEIEAEPMPRGDPAGWSALQRVRASYHAPRSGDYYVVLKPLITPIPQARAGSTVATHGSIWDYDRRVPILVWRKGLVPFEQPLAVSTVDILPTLAPLLALPVPAAEIDGICRDLDPGPASTCGQVR